MELVKALIDGAAKKGLMMTASQPLLHLHWRLHKYMYVYTHGTQIHVCIHAGNTNTSKYMEHKFMCKYIRNHIHLILPIYVFLTK